jgi:alkyl hydroperoxide reductase subunit F
MLDNNIKAQLKAYFEKIVNPIVLTASLDGSSNSDRYVNPPTRGS